MSIAGHVAVFSSIILALAVGDLAISFHRLMTARAPVKWDWMVLALALLMLLQIVVLWWATYRWYVGLTTFSIGAFLPDLALLILVFLATAAVLPDDVPDDGVDLRAHYWRISRYFWALAVPSFMLIFVFVIPRDLEPGTPLSAVLIRIWPNVLYLVLSIAAMISRRTWLHMGTIVILLTGAIWNYLPEALV